jgi:ribonuclease D
VGVVTEAAEQPSELAASAPEPVPLLVPREGTPAPIRTATGLAAAVAALAIGRGPVAIDAERASGYRYSQRAYLVQVRREGAGTYLIDPLPFAGREGGLSDVDDALADAEWVLHAATQDLPCLSELRMRPRRLFDTELAGRLAGFERVGLGPIVERLLGLSLEKGHSAADWSTRPLPAEWLTYAALDVEVLVDLRDALAAELERQGKLGWALEEFDALTRSQPPAPRPDPWRRVSGIHRVRTTRGLARVRALWQARDEIARTRDVAPGRVLPDSAIVAAAQAGPKDLRELLVLPVYSGRATRRLADRWLAALAAARDLPEAELPERSAGGEPYPPPHRWADRDPAAATRLVGARAAVQALATEHQLPPENLVSPDLVRRLAWSPPAPLTADAVGDALLSTGARHWQVGLVAGPLTAVLELA